MIGKLRGTLVEAEGNVGLIETAGGVYYRVYLLPSLLASRLPSAIEVYTYLQVREDALMLYGFSEKKEYDLFSMLLGVPSVGPKTAYSVVTFTKVEELIEAIKSNDLQYFTRIQGLGKKTAMKIILELSQKLKEDFQLEKMYLSEEDKTVVDALVSLGFKSNDARNILNHLPKDISIEERIREGIRLGSQHKK